MSVSEYAATFTKKMKLVPTKLSKVNKFANGLSVDFGLTVKLATTLKASIFAAKNVETQIREKSLEKYEARENRKFEESSWSNKKGRFLKSDLDDKKFGSSSKAKWCEKRKKKHSERCDGEL